MKLLAALRNASRRLAADFEDSKLFQHSGDKGEFREYIITRFLRPFLPECYGIGSGEIFSTSGQYSKQIDLVLFDSVFSNVLFRDANNSLFPCEAVYGLIEVKSNLSVKELKTSIDNVASVKKLERNKSDMMDILPFRRLSVGDGLWHSRLQRNPYLGVVFAYDGVTAQTAIDMLWFEYLTKEEFPKNHLPDFIFSYQRGYTILKAIKQDNSNNGRIAKLGEEFNDYAVLQTGEDTLPLFFLTLNICLNQIILKAPDFDFYWTQILNEVLKENA